MRVKFLAYVEKHSENLRKFSHCKLHKDMYCSAPNTEVSLEHGAKEHYYSVPNFLLLTRK